MTYDTWKTTNPADNEPGGECDCCGRAFPLANLSSLYRDWVSGIKIWECDECCEEYEARELAHEKHVDDDEPIGNVLGG